MIKRAVPAVLGFLSLCLPLAAQPQTQSPEQLSLDGTTLDRPLWRQPSLLLDNQDRFFFSTAFGSMRPTEDFLPAFAPLELQSFALPAATSRRDSRNNFVDLRAPERISFGGEVGFLYGKSSGKYGREDFLTYIVGTVGNEHFSITAGASHLESSGSIPRRGR